MAKQRRLRWLLIFAGGVGFWALVAVFFASQNYMAAAYRDRPMSWRQALTFPATFYFIWALLTPGVVWLAARFPIERRRWLRSLAIHLPASAAFSLAQVGLFVQVIPYLYSSGRRVAPGDLWGTMVVANIHSNLLYYWLLVGITLAFIYYRKFRERELRASQLEAQLAQAELQVLKMQLHPHFLFNTLHAISALVHEDAEAADRMITRLADLLRLTLESHGTQEVALKRELEFLERYLEIEQIRFGERLRVRRRIDAATLDARVPYLILQPLVENAIRHGVAPRRGGGSLEIRARLVDGALRLEVCDDGPGLRSGKPREGLGLANTRARLEQLYGTEQRFELGNSTEGGLMAALTIPYRSAEEDEAEGNEDSRADRG